MFTGIIEEIGVVKSVAATAAGKRLTISCRAVSEGVAPGDSVAVSGVCVTAVACAPPTSPSRPGLLEADVMRRTLELTTLGDLRAGRRVNLERALRLGGRVGGHFVLGHVDGRGELRARRAFGTDTVLCIAVDGEIARALVPRGSIAVDGVSLTIARIEPGMLYVHCIPFTLRHTTLGEAAAGAFFNLETDILGKHSRPKDVGRITEDFLREKGF